MTQDSSAIGPPGSLAPTGWGTVSWQVAAPVLLVLFSALLVLYFDTSLSMYDLWSRQHTFDHAFLIIPVCLFLVWERRGTLARTDPAPSVLGLLFVAGSGAIWLVADTTDVLIGSQFALIAMAEGLVLAVLGWRVFRTLLFPLMYFWLVLPTDLNLLPFLQKISTVAATWGIELLGIPAFVEGVLIEIPSGRYWVAPGCAGLNFLLSGFALSILYVEQMYTSWGKRIAGVLAMLIVAVVANWFRIFALIAAGHYWNAVYDINDHYLEGWLFFAAIVFIMMWFGLRFRDPLPTPDDKPAGAARQKSPTGSRLGAYGAVVIACAAAIGFYPAYAAYRAGDASVAAPAQVVLPSTVGAWRTVAEVGDWRPVFETADAQKVQRYTDGRRTLDIFVAYYEFQGEGREVVSYTNRADYDGRWTRLGVGTTTARLDGQTAELTAIRMRAGEERRLVWQTYWVDGRYSRRPTVAKLLQAKAELLFGDRRAGFLAVSAAGDVDALVLKEFLSKLPPFPSLVAAGG